MAIAASFMISQRVGISTTIAVFFHEIPHEIGDFALLIKFGYSRKRAVLAQFITAFGAVMGTLAVLWFGNVDSFSEYILPFTAGGFIYIATVDVIPELLLNTTVWQTIKEMIAISFGIAIMALIAIYE